MADGIITQDQLALGSDTADSGALAQVEKASRYRLMLAARLAAIAVFGGGAHLESLADTLQQ